MSNAVNTHSITESDTHNTMDVQRLVLENFRNYSQLILDDIADIMVVTGENGAGKTNLLEAVSLLSEGRGLRNDSLQHLIKSGAKSCSIFAEMYSLQGDVTIGSSVDLDGKRLVKLDGETLKQHHQLNHFISMISLTPQTDLLLGEGSTARRKFLDKLTASFMPEHSKHISQYDNARQERMRLLIRRNADTTWLNVLEARMAEQAVAIAAARQDTVARLCHYMQETQHWDKQLYPNIALTLNGTAEQYLGQHNALEAESLLKQAWHDARQQDAENKRTNMGVHRSDLEIIHPMKKLPIELCSTGEQKIMLLSLLLATIYARKAWLGSPPILLLDEVICHLDEAHKTALFQALKASEAQTWITHVDQEAVHALKSDKTRVITVEQGSILG